MTRPKKARNTPRKLTQVFAWDRLENESDAAWIAFTHYRDMRYHDPSTSRKLNGRSIPVLSERLGVKQGRVEGYSRRYKWGERVRAYDSWVDGEIRQKGTVKQAADIVEEQLKAAGLMRATGLLALQKLAEHLRDEDIPDLRLAVPRIVPLIRLSVAIENKLLGIGPEDDGTGLDPDEMGGSGDVTQSVIIIPDNGRSSE